MTEKDVIISVYPSGTRGKITRKRRLRTVYIVVNEEYDILTDHIYSVTTIPEVFDTKIKAQDYIKRQHFPEEYYILPRKLK